jgi:hypothetical protein
MIRLAARGERPVMRYSMAVSEAGFSGTQIGLICAPRLVSVGELRAAPRRLRPRLHHGPQSHQVIVLAATGHLGMAAAGQIPLAVVSCDLHVTETGPGKTVSCR